jgi:hypothetical protein
MKRIHPNPAGLIASSSGLKRQYLEPQYTFPTLPKELIHFILSFLDFKSILAAQRTCRALGPIVEDDLLWQDVFNQDFQDTPLVAPGKGALEEYKRQCRFVTNLIGGNFALRVFITKELGTSHFAVTPDGRFIIGDVGNPIKILDDSKTDHWVKLGKSEDGNPRRLLCDSKICVAVNSNGRMRAWNINTYEPIPIPQGTTGFSEDAEPSQTTLVNGRLLQCTLNGRVIKVWDPESKDATVLSFKFDHPVTCMTLYNETLLCGKHNSAVELCDMTTNARKVHQSIGLANQIYAISETKYFISKERLPPEKTVTCVNYTDDCYDVSSLILPTYPGVSGNFTRHWHPGKSPRPCSQSELSSMFQAFSADTFGDPLRTPESEKFPYLSSLRERVGSCLGLAYSRGGLYQACHLKMPAGSAIFYADFTASNEEILLEIANMCSDNRLIETASKRLGRMPQSVLEPIARIYDKIAEAKRSTSPSFWKDAILEYLNPGSNRDVLLTLANRFCDEQFIEDAAKELMSMPVSVREAIAKNYKKISFVREETSALLWKHAVLEYLTPGSIIKEADILNKVIEMLMSDDELEREYGANSFYKRVAPFTEEAIAKIQKEVAARPDFAQASPTAILMAAILEYLEKCNKLQAYGRTYQITTIES